MSPTATLLAFGLLVKGSLKREFLGAPIKALWKHILLPTAVVCFISFLASGRRQSRAGRCSRLRELSGCSLPTA